MMTSSNKNSVNSTAPTTTIANNKGKRKPRSSVVTEAHISIEGTPQSWPSLARMLWQEDGHCIASNLVSLRCSRCQLASLGPQLGSLSQLKELDLSHNSLIALPDELFVLSELRILDLSDNLLESLSSRVGRLMQLEELRLANNRLRSLPFDYLLGLPHIKSINVHANLLDTQAIVMERLAFANCICVGLFLQRLPNRLVLPQQLSLPFSEPQKDALSRLFIGAIESTWDVQELRRLGITHILSVGVPPSQEVRRSSALFQSLYIDFADFPTEDLRSRLVEGSVLRFIDEGTSPGRGCLVHCLIGVSRSASFVIAWLISRYKLGFDEALAWLKRSRYCVQPNLGFQDQLIEWASLNAANNNPSVFGDRGRIAVTTSTSTNTSTEPRVLTSEEVVNASPNATVCPSVFGSLFFPGAIVGVDLLRNLASSATKKPPSTHNTH